MIEKITHLIEKLEQTRSLTVEEYKLAVERATLDLAVKLRLMETL